MKKDKNLNDDADEDRVSMVFLPDVWPEGSADAFPLSTLDECVADLAFKLAAGDLDGLASTALELADAAEMRMPQGGPCAVLTETDAHRDELVCHVELVRHFAEGIDQMPSNVFVVSKTSPLALPLPIEALVVPNDLDCSDAVQFDRRRRLFVTFVDPEMVSWLWAARKLASRRAHARSRDPILKGFHLSTTLVALRLLRADLEAAGEAFTWVMRRGLERKRFVRSTRS